MILSPYLKSNESKSLDALVYEDYQYGKHIVQYQHDDVNLGEVDIAFLSWRNKGDATVREALYRLKCNFQPLKVLDLGAVIDEEMPLIELMDILIQSKVFPIIVSTEKEAVVAQLKAYEQRQELLNVSLVDSCLPFSPYQPKALINQLLAFHPHLLLYINCIGHQGYLVDDETIAFLEDKYFDTHRLGLIQQDIAQVEPLVRQADLAAFDINAIRCADAPARATMNSNGLFAVEACQIVRYMAMSDRVSSFSLYGFDLEYDTRNQTANLIAQMIWFVIGGFGARMHEYPADVQEMTAYLVDSSDIDEPLTFYKSAKSDRWWIAIPKAIAPQHQLVPCSYEDYQLSCNGELPDRLINAISRLRG